MNWSLARIRYSCMLQLYLQGITYADLIDNCFCLPAYVMLWQHFRIPPHKCLIWLTGLSLCSSESDLCHRTCTLSEALKMVASPLCVTCSQEDLAGVLVHAILRDNWLLCPHTWHSYGVQCVLNLACLCP